ncbi:transposase [Synechococcus sp. PCC 7336]|uniref:transposase n=1 Tax=Synechococcus sp. PCC 7336 TaxID=195250 RepID=UPI0008FC071E
MLNLVNLLDDAKCYETVRQLRWPEGVHCPKCGCEQVNKRGKDDTQPNRQRYCCQGCGKQFDDLTDTIFAGRR